ncbi:hypothetical protein CDD82_5375 [Ophiocordyceps australis]|uniref:Putative 5'-nucleotidase C-terminal domain-containing protein n=1 Tax=Ophiocordyceps australis TaxID=1399860 RepID=A0A2C5Z155_9HYPO|nr:hypothetical protein CDD82_5375 [Ophiocordyceps australis]
MLAPPSSLLLLLPIPGVLGCPGGCYGPMNQIEHVRHVKRMQPGAVDAAYGPTKPLEWGQVNFVHTTDTHGWLQGHIKEQNYGADWGDFVTFTRRMAQTARNKGVDLLLIDTGDLHDGTGLSDSTEVDGASSMPIFDEIDYDLLAMGNHELYVSDVAYQMFHDYARRWGDRYVTSNIKVFNQSSGQFEYVGATHRYFTTHHGLRIMAFGLLFDFKGNYPSVVGHLLETLLTQNAQGNSNASQVIEAKKLVQQDWFNEALACDQPVDLFIILGHNPVRQTDRYSTFQTVVDAIRARHPKTPIQIFGGHTHIRDFAVYDNSSVALESGRFCETLGWLSMSGFDSSNSCFKGAENPRGVPNPSRRATNTSTTPFTYSRRYLDWNRKTFAYHSNHDNQTYDTAAGQQVTNNITATRNHMRLGQVYGCAPQDWCSTCAPLNSTDNIFPGVIYPAVSAVVMNQTRADRARIIMGNTGIVRFDLHRGPFTYDDSFIVIPFRDPFLYIADVPFDKASQVIHELNKGPIDKRDLVSMPVPEDECTNPTLGYSSAHDSHKEPRGIVRRQQPVVPGYVTSDDWGTDGDDTMHSGIPDYDLPGYWEARASFPHDGSNPSTVDLIFFDFIQGRVLNALGPGYTRDMVSCYMACNFTSQDFLLPYAEQTWQANKDNCPVL